MTREEIESQKYNLAKANLAGVSLSWANLNGADLRGANLAGADLTGATLMLTNLSRANLTGVNLEGASLRETNLEGAHIWGTSLVGAVGVVPAKMLLCWWASCSEKLTRELMRYDAANHPDPTAFDRWADGGPCPYEGTNYGRASYFFEVKTLWVPGPAKRPYDLMIALFEEHRVEY